MAAPLKELRNCIFSGHRRFVTISASRCYVKKYWERGIDSLKETGETKKDRYIGFEYSEFPHPETPIRGQYELEPVKGRIHDKKPFPAELEAGKQYKWCACGNSKTQPFCDGTHKFLYRQHQSKTTANLNYPLISPVVFKVKKTKSYWLCNCKQTDNRPFCDGTHKREDIQKKVKG